MNDLSTIETVGVALIGVGIVLVIYQMIFSPNSLLHSRSASFGPKGILFQTSFPGLVVLLIGVVVLIVGPRLAG